jgi:Zn-dependent alcohol dehydrogenase
VEREPEEAHYVARVLRFRHGDRLALIDGGGQLWTATLEQPAMLKLEQPLEQPLERAGRPAPTITLAMAVPKRDAELAWRMATELGATHVIDPVASLDLAASVRAILPQGVDYAFDTTGRPDTLTAIMGALAPKGVLGIVGIPPAGTPMPGDLGSVLTFGQTVRGIIEGDSDPDVFIPDLIAHWRAGRLPLERLVKVFAFDQINTAIASQHHGDCVKVVLTLPDPA